MHVRWSMCSCASWEALAVLQSDYITYADTLDCLVYFIFHPSTVAHVRYDLAASFHVLTYDTIWLLVLLSFVQYQSGSHTYYDT